VAAVAVAGALGVVVGRQWASTSTTTIPTTTASSIATATTTTKSAEQPITAIWPFASTVTRFADPVLAAQAFATSYLGFVDPIIGAFRRGDSRSGEVPVHASSTGPVMTVLVREMTSDNSWWILGASCPDITVTAPLTGSQLTSPLVVRGRSTSFEAVVNVDVLQDGSLTPLGHGVVLGGSMGVPGPFHASIVFSPPSSSAGALVMRILSAKDGHVVQASAMRILFTR
jgi:hypothetical protein